jgi:hypothetical protein
MFRMVTIFCFTFLMTSIAMAGIHSATSIKNKAIELYQGPAGNAISFKIDKNLPKRKQASEKIASSHEKLGDALKQCVFLTENGHITIEKQTEITELMTHFLEPKKSKKDKLRFYKMTPGINGPNDTYNRMSPCSFVVYVENEQKYLLLQTYYNQ